MGAKDLEDRMELIRKRHDDLLSAAYTATSRIAGDYKAAEQEAAMRELAVIQIKATLLGVDATLLAAEPQPLWSPPVVGEIETTTDRGERSARVRELLGRLEGSDMTTVGDMNNLRELKRLVFDMLDNPTYPAVEIEATADQGERSAWEWELLDTLREEDRVPLVCRRLDRAFDELKSLLGNPTYPAVEITTAERAA
jgi:hypothetical protein